MNNNYTYNNLYTLIQDEDGETPLHRAILLHQVAPVKLLLEAGADPTRLNNYKNSAVHLACGMGNAG